MIFFHFKFDFKGVSEFEGWSGRHFMRRPWAALSLATPLCQWVFHQTLLLVA